MRDLLLTSLLFVLAIHFASRADALSVSTRRRFVVTTAAAVPFAAAAAVAPPGWALDMDAFVNQQLADEVCDEKINKKCAPKLTEDEALCRYGFPSKKTGEACVRANMSTKRSGGLDAFGTYDRGDFVRCKTFYDDKGDRYEKKVVCE